MFCLYRVTIESDGGDCDGPIAHPTHHLVCDYGDLAKHIGFAFMSHGAGSIAPKEDKQQEWTALSFGHRHEEGFSRTQITYLELSNSELFLDYFNNFLTVEKFAENYGLSEEQAARVILEGHAEHELNVAYLRGNPAGA